MSVANPCETSMFISNSLFKNCIVFFTEAIRHFNQGIDKYENKIMAIITTQMALELSIKYTIANQYDVKDIFESINNISDDDLLDAFKNNKLRVKEFDRLKNYMKAKREYSEILSTEFNYMDKFQLYRNRLVHQNYNFSKEEELQLKNDIVHIFVYILYVLLSGDVNAEEYREYVFEYIPPEEYEKLLLDSTFSKEIKEKFKDEYGELYICPDCETRTLTPHKKCYKCLYLFDNPAIYKYLECSYCSKKLVLVDALNIDDQSDHCLRGICLNCQEDTIVYKCPKCQGFYNIENFKSDNCIPFERCIVYDRKINT